MLCTEIDGLRRTIREREVTLGDKSREISSLESARQEITEMRNETEAARDAFYEHKESWEKSITAELTAQVTALREQVFSWMRRVCVFARRLIADKCCEFNSSGLS